MENLKKSKLSQIHTFPYSIRKGTIAEKLEGHLPDNVKEERALIIKKISASDARIIIILITATDVLDSLSAIWIFSNTLPPAITAAENRNKTTPADAVKTAEIINSYTKCLCFLMP